MVWPVIAGQVAGGLLNRQSGKKARKQIRRSTGQAVETLQPWRQAGLEAFQELHGNAEYFAGPQEDIAGMAVDDPGYEFRRQQGELALERGAAAGGLRGSSTFLKGMMKYNQGLASQEFANAWGRGIQRHGLEVERRGRWASILGGIGNAGQSASMGIANALTGGAAREADIMTSEYSAHAQTLSNIGSAIYQNQQAGKPNVLNEWLMQQMGYGGGGGGKVTGTSQGGQNIVPMRQGRSITPST